MNPELLRDFYNLCIPCTCLGLLGIGGYISFTHLARKAVRLTDVSGTRRDTPEYLEYRRQQLEFEKQRRMLEAARNIVTDPEDLKRASQARLVNPKS